MDEKKPMLVALTPEAEETLGGRELVLPWFPFRMGRDSRIDGLDDITSGERRSGGGRPNNDLFIRDRGQRKNVSREHLQIEQLEDGSFQVFERGSACGTVVGNSSIGGHRKRESCKLEDGNVIIVGTPGSPFVFKFQLESDQD